MTISLEELGITKDELQAKIVEQAVEALLGLSCASESAIANAVRGECEKIIEERVSAFCEKHILPNVTRYVENVCLQETNKWGEKQGVPLTFKEYLVARAEHYLTEEVNFEGKAKDARNYNWSKTQTRISYLVHQHLHYSIAQAMKEAIATANKAIVGGLEETVKIKLAEVAEKLQVNVKTGR